MPSSDAIAEAVNVAKASLLDVSDAPMMPDSMRGLLSSASAQAGRPLSAVGSVVFRTPPQSGKLLRTGAGFLDAISQRTRVARTPADLDEAVVSMLSRLTRTGAYSSVVPTLEADAEGAPRLAVVLDELQYSSVSGIESSPGTGRTRVTTSAALINGLGCAETMSIRIGNEGTPTSLLSSGEGDLMSSMKPNLPVDAAVRSAQSTAPNVFAEIRKPALGGSSITAFARARREWVPYDSTSGVNLKLVESDVGIADESGRQCLTATFSLRQPVPHLRPDEKFASAVCGSIAAQCQPSTKHSLVYDYNNDNIVPSASSPASGHALSLRAELAGLGGDVHFAKMAATGTFAASIGRFAPDTGFALPSVGVEGSSNGSDSLAPHPGSGVLSWWTGRGLRRIANSDRRPLLAALSGWLSPGVTAIVDVFAGGLFPWGPSKSRGSLFPDRFHAHALRLRGLSSIGGRGEVVERGLPAGDALGGDIAAIATARIMLPPPLPSTALSNSGARSYAFTSASFLAPLSTLTVGADIPKLLNFSGGIGLVRLDS
jgi:hypothetical protein